MINRVVIVDDHPIVRRGIVQMVNEEPDFEVCGEAEDAHEALLVLERTDPNVVIVDITLKKSSGLELVKDIKNQYPSLPIMILSMHDEAVYAERAIRTGAMGYVMKQEKPKRILEGLRKILTGQIFVSDRISTMMWQTALGRRKRPKDSPIEILTDREVEVFQLIGQGMSTREIAEALNLSNKTIETHRSNIMKKLQVKVSTGLVKFAVQFLANPQTRT